MYAYEERHNICWNKARVLQIKPVIYLKYKESTHMSLPVNMLSQPSLDTSPSWIPTISEEEVGSYSTENFIVLTDCFTFVFTRSIGLSQFLST
jgi:hypothetical protein